MEKISFCINTSRNERNHIELLLKSLYKNLSHREHEIIVYVENDNQGTTEWLLTQKQNFSDLKIIKNPLPIPLDYARNINIMFEMAKHDIVSYLQSDMVICPSYDVEILKHLTPTNIISSTRIEPPLHPPSPEKITFDLGLDPLTFDFDKFTDVVNKYKQDILTNFWFAPFTLYKKIWNDIGGHDTLFRRSRVDSDILYRFCINGIEIKQTWSALVYHFTCTSSRGPEWWTEKSKQRTQLQNTADQVELARFIRKWGTFRHPNTPEEVKSDFKYNISANFYNVTPFDMDILNYHFLFEKIYIDNVMLKNKIQQSYKDFHTPANKMHSIEDYEWDMYKKYYRTLEFTDIFVDSPITSDDVIYHIDLKNELFSNLLQDPCITHRQLLINNYKDSIGEFEANDSIKITINNPVNRIKENIKITNPSIESLSLIIL